MPRIDPVKLLSCIGVLLSPTGGIRSATEVKRLAGLMTKYSKKLVSKCIYIQILKCTETELLGQFMSVGGWGLVHAWLQDGIESKNWPLVEELLELLLLCPVDVPRLQSNSAPKLVKGLSREEENDGVRILATKLVEQWLKIARGENPSQNQNKYIISRENISDSQSLTTDRAVQMRCDSSSDNADEISTVDGSLYPSQLNENGLNGDDDYANGLSESGESESLIFKITKKDGKQIYQQKNVKINDTSPKKNGNRASIESIKDSDSEDRSLKVRNEKSHDGRHKDGKDRSGKDVDKHKKSSSSSSSSSSSHKISSSSKSSSSKHNTSTSSSKSSSAHGKTHKTGSSSSSSSSNHKSSSSGSLSSSSRDKDKHKSSSSKSSSSSSSSSSKDKKSESSKTQAEKDKDTLAKIQPKSLEKVGKIPKKSNSSLSSSSDGSTKKPATENPQDLALSAAKKKSISIEVRKDTENRPKTVKTYNTQFRSHGLNEEAPPPPSRRDLKKPTTATTVPTNSLPIVPKRSLSPTNATKELEKKMKLSTSPTIEKPGAIKLIPAKPKPSVLLESDMFSNAISAVAAKKEPKKRRRISSVKESENIIDKTATQKTDSKDATKAVTATPLKFYQDTLEDSENKDGSDSTKKDIDASDDGETKEKRPKVDDDSSEDKNGETPMETAESPDESQPEEEEIKMPGPGCGPDGPPGVLTLHRRKGPKKSLRWRPQETLEEIRYFELDETERVNVTKQFADAKQIERSSEREAFLIGRKTNNDDTMAEQMEWAPLILVDDVPEHVVKSKEKDNQAEREKTCLKTIYFNRAMIPDSPIEPDVISYQNIEPPVIPLYDVTGNTDAIHDYTNMPWPEAKGSPPHQMGGGGIGGTNMDDLNGMSNFGAFGSFNGMNWPGQPMLNIRPPPQIGLIMPGAPDPMNPLAMNPMHAFNAPNPLAPMMGQLPPNNMGFMNNFGQPMPPMMNDNRGNRGQNWFGGGGGGGGGNNSNNWPAQGPNNNNNNNNNQRNNWISNRKVCKQFQRGFCRHGKNCKFLHPGENSGSKF